LTHCGLLSRFLPLLCHARIDVQPINITPLIGLRQPGRIDGERDRRVAVMPMNRRWWAAFLAWREGMRDGGWLFG
jgi:hypothetical protein